MTLGVVAIPLFQRVLPALVALPAERCFGLNVWWHICRRKTLMGYEVSYEPRRHNPLAEFPPSFYIFLNKNTKNT
jgi:hypothetical protein